RRLTPSVQRDELALGHLAQESRGLADAVAMNPSMERVREIEALARARDADVAESALLLDLVLVVHRPGVREHALLHAGQEHGRELESLGRVECHQGHPRALFL